MEENKILQKFVQHDQQLKKIDEHFEAVDKHLDRHDKQFEVIIAKLVENDEKLDNMVTKDEFQELRGEMLQGQDEMITILKRLDEDRFSTISRIDRIENEVGIHGTEINNIKVHLNMP